jgi:hypothetical protein
LIDWLRLLIHESYNPEDLENFDLRQTLPPASYALLKNEQDLETFSRIQKRNYRN